MWLPGSSMLIELSRSMESHEPKTHAHVPSQHFMLSLGTRQKTLEASDLYVSVPGFYLPCEHQNNTDQRPLPVLVTPAKEDVGPHAASGSYYTLADTIID